MEIPKSLEELVLAHANLEQDGISALRQNDFLQSIKIFSACIDKDKNNWQARLCLGLAYFNADQIYAAASHFRYLKQHCPDKTIRNDAIAALVAVEQELKSRRKPNNKFYA